MFELDDVVNFLNNRGVLVLARNSSLFERIRLIMTQQGVARESFDFAFHVEGGLKVMKQKKPGLIIADYYLVDGTGFDFFTSYNRENECESLHVLVTSDLSHSSVAKAAEEDVDCYLLRPFSDKQFKDVLFRSLWQMRNPSDYRRKILTGKKYFEIDPRSARDEFESALELNESPSLAYYYIGKLDEGKGWKEVASEDYRQGLVGNSIHFKCQLALFENLMERGLKRDAYNVLKNIVLTFPQNEERLAKAIHLCMIFGKFEDIELYYAAYGELVDKNAKVINHMCSALYITGKYFVRENQTLKAKKFFSLVKENIEEWRDVLHIYKDKKEEINFYLDKIA